MKNTLGARPPHSPGFFPSGEHRWGEPGDAGWRTAREVKDEVVRMGNGQSAFVPWDDRRVVRRE